MHNGNSSRCDFFTRKAEIDYRINPEKRSHYYRASYKVKIQMDKSRTFCVLTGSDRRDKCGNTGPDILPHNYRYSRTDG